MKLIPTFTVARSIVSYFIVKLIQNLQKKIWVFELFVIVLYYIKLIYEKKVNFCLRLSSVKTSVNTAIHYHRRANMDQLHTLKFKIFKY